MDDGRRSRIEEEIERKKAKLAEMKKAKEENRRQLLNSSGSAASPMLNSRGTLTCEEITKMLTELEVPASSRHSEETAASKRTENEMPSFGLRSISLDLSMVHSEGTAPKNNLAYTKFSQTDDAPLFSPTGSQEYDEDETLPMRHLAASPLEEEKKEKEEKVEPLPDLSEEEKHQILSTPSFVNFLEHNSRVIMRALAEDDIFSSLPVDSSAGAVNEKKRLLSHNRNFFDEKWSSRRSVVGLSFSPSHPELLAVAYDELPEISGEPNGVVAVYNLKFKKASPEYIFTCSSRLTSVSFAMFHPHLIIGGCYSGQLVLWDFRPDKHNITRKTPCNKSPLSVHAHTHPVYSLAVVGSSNAHNIVSLSTDGRLCVWEMETLSQPVFGKECVGRPGRPPVAVLCSAFPPNDVNNLIVAGEDGGAYLVSRHAASGGAEKIFEGHSAPVAGVSFHPSSGPIDFSHIFLTASMDWTVRLWSLKDPKLRLSLEAHTDAVYDVAWSPAHPAVFASVDTEGNLFLWNLNEDVEGPVARMRLTSGGGVEEDGEGNDVIAASSPLVLRKLSWSANGQYLLVGGADGFVRLFDVHEQMCTSVRSEEWSKFARMLADVRQTTVEVEELSGEASGFGAYQSPAMTTGGGSSSPSCTPRASFAQLPGQSTAAALVASSSPRLIF